MTGIVKRSLGQDDIVTTGQANKRGGLRMVFFCRYATVEVGVVRVIRVPEGWLSELYGQMLFRFRAACG